MNFWQLYSEAALTTVGFFWKAPWAFILAYVVSSAIQVFVTRDRMEQAMGEAGQGSIALATFFGFISSSCSFSALATPKALFQEGAGFVPALVFRLASTNLVIELGIIIAVFLSIPVSSTLALGSFRRSRLDPVWGEHHASNTSQSGIDRVFFGLAIASYLWLAGGLITAVIR